MCVICILCDIKRTKLRSVCVYHAQAPTEILINFLPKLDSPVLAAMYDFLTMWNPNLYLMLCFSFGI